MLIVNERHLIQKACTGMQEKQPSPKVRAKFVSS